MITIADGPRGVRTEPAPLAAETSWVGVDSPLGRLILIGTDEVITGVHFGADAPSAPLAGIAAEPRRATTRLADQLAEYFVGERASFDVRLAPTGTDFQRAVWRALTTIPYAQTASYSRIAALIDRAGSQRAVGTANRSNPIAIVVPCHRVIASDGSVCGYAGGTNRKLALLNLEQANR